jgi:hypothetical protein
MAFNSNTDLTRVVRERYERFREANDYEPLAKQVRILEQDAARCTQVRQLRRRNALLADVRRLRHEMARRKRRAELFEELTLDVREAADIVGHGPPPTTLTIGPPRAKRSRRTDMEDIVTVLDDAVLMIDDGQRLQDVRAQVDDVCNNCGALMERDVHLSFLMCPNTECQHMRYYHDTSTYATGGGTNVARTDKSRHPPKRLAHYATFLSVAQGKTRYVFKEEELNRISFYCYVNGARRTTDIDRHMVNAAQRYTGTTRYNLSPLLQRRLCGDQLRMAPEFVKLLLLLFKTLWPAFFRLRAHLDEMRINMINFSFVSRVLCRLTGHDAFLHLFEPLRMHVSLCKHGAFMRRLFQELGWQWEDGKLVEKTDAELDAYEAEEDLKLAQRRRHEGIAVELPPSAATSLADM